MPRILVIDDEQLLRSTVVMILTRAGFTVVEASDGQAGIAMFHKNPPDIVLTDIFMPNRDGIEIIKELKHSSPLTKIIAMTGGGKLRMMEIASAAQVLGADYVLDKPFDSESLLTAINAVLVTPLPTRSQHGPDT
jgi:DNA-binding response OmpR family regulator